MLESLLLCNIVVDEALVDVCTAWRKHSHGLHLPANAMDAIGRQARSVAGSAARITHLVYVGDMCVVVQSASEPEGMFTLLHAAVTVNGSQREARKEMRDLNR